MALCCCGNWRVRMRPSKTNKEKNNNIVKSDQINEETPLAVVNQETESITDKSTEIKEVQPRVVMRSEVTRAEHRDHVSDKMPPSKLTNSRGSSLLKSVLHRSIRFDDDCIDNFENRVTRKPVPTTPKPIVATSRRGSLYIFRNADDIIITPFAQILASLRKVRANFMLITNTGSNSETRYKFDEQETLKMELLTTDISKKDDSTKLIASETLNELEWCLDRLENIQTHRSVSDMASTKFKQIINRELSQYAETSKSGHQISDYICKTFLDSPLDDNLPEASSAERELEEVDDQRRNELSKYGPKLIKANTASQFKCRESDTESLLNNEVNAQVEDNTVVHFNEDNLPILGVYVPNEGDVIEIINQNLLKWGMDLFHFSEITMGQSLTVISFAIFKHHNLINKFQINSKILIQFLINVEKSYRSSVPYHNSIHAADVTQSANVLLNGPALDNVFSDLEILSVIFACIVHDMDHPGVTNQYLVNSSSELATLYNDSSVLENHHLAMAFTLLANKECDFLTILSKRQKQSMRRMIIDMVLATDMSKHMTLLADLKTMVETKKVAGSGILTLDTYTDRIQILQNLVHCSDLSNPTKPLFLYQIWTGRIMEEFFLQGDKERESDLEISPMCDRQTATVEKSQVSFIDFIVHPLWETWSELVYPDSQGILDTLEENRQWYFNMSKEKGLLSEKLA